MRIVVLGLSITSSWGNGHATNFRALCGALRRRGHDVLVRERDVPWYASSRDFAAPFVRLYGSLDELRHEHAGVVRAADLTVVGSFVPEGASVGEWALETAEGAVAFWDIDTPVTAAKLAGGDCDYLSQELVARYDLYLSFTGGPLLDRLGALRPVPFYCMVDTDHYRPLPGDKRFALGYLGTFSADRQQALEELLVEPARRLPQEPFVVAGPQYPDDLVWPENVERHDHVAPPEHPLFYAQQRLTLNVTRGAMVEAGWSPSVRLFEAAACAVPVVSDRWAGLDAFFLPGEEILVADAAEDVVTAIEGLDDAALGEIGRRARERVLAEHTADKRAEQLEEQVAGLVRQAA
jgi:spore maturation protein CgeB